MDVLDFFFVQEYLDLNFKKPHTFNMQGQERRFEKGAHQCRTDPENTAFKNLSHLRNHFMNSTQMVCQGSVVIPILYISILESLFGFMIKETCRACKLAK